MGTRRVSPLESVESPIRVNWKNAIVAATGDRHVMLEPAKAPALRALRIQRSERLEREPGSAMFVLETAAEIIARMVRESHEVMGSLAKNHLRR